MLGAAEALFAEIVGARVRVVTLDVGAATESALALDAAVARRTVGVALAFDLAAVATVVGGVATGVGTEPRTISRERSQARSSACSKADRLMNSSWVSIVE